ncbi:MAG: protein-disulfide reductase DsbD [Cellvibrionales bacterium]|nr:protein-disulfide reductase DsbD [Cellvibrionales bacterium]
MLKHPIYLFFSLLLLFSLLTQATNLTDLSPTNDPFAKQQAFLAVDEAYHLNIIQSNDKGNISLLWQAKPAHYLYRHGFKVEWIDPDTNSLHHLNHKDLLLPKGKKMEDPYFGEVTAYYDTVEIPLPIKLTDKPIFLKASSQGCADAGLCYPIYSLYLKIEPNGEFVFIDDDAYQAANGQETKQTTGEQTQHSLLTFLFFAFLGGLILNLMPCVLPVLGLKAFQLSTHGQARSEGIAYLAGVILSFVLIASVMLGLRGAGHQIGWGFQLQQPGFILALVYLFFVLGLSLSGFFHLGARLMGIGQDYSSQKGVSGSFFTGVLAVIVASPCTAPFMGVALGAASTQPWYIAISVFVALGIGMALPLTIISFFPALSKLLPKPGAWMERLKEFFAFPLYFTAIWLLWVLGKQAGIDAVIMACIGCVLIVFTLWLMQSNGKLSRFLAILSLIAVLGSFATLSWLNNRASTVEFVAFDKNRLHELTANHTPVFLEFTADWCITCKTNEATTLHTIEIQSAFKEAGIIYMVGDWTNEDPKITAFLNQHGRNGVPLYLFYSGKEGETPHILPQLLTKSIVLDAINDDRSK